MNKNINDIFKENLNYYMQVKGKTQKELAKYLNISTAMANYYIAGKNTPRMDKVDKICRFLGIERSDLLEQRTLKLQSIEDVDFTGIERIASQLKNQNLTSEDIEFIQNSINFVLEKNKHKKG